LASGLRLQKTRYGLDKAQADCTVAAEKVFAGLGAARHK